MNEKEIWLNYKSTLSYSHIRCSVCTTPMYYGNNVLITTGETLVFNCKCSQKISIERPKPKQSMPTERSTQQFDQICAECGRDVLIKNLKEHAIRFRCTCGHNDLCLVKEIENTVRL